MKYFEIGLTKDKRPVPWTLHNIAEEKKTTLFMAGRINSVEKSILSKLFYRVKAIPVNISEDFL